MKRVLRISFVIALCLMAGGIASAGEVMFNYQGHLSTQGAPFDGAGEFKFMILAKEGNDDYILWVNNGDTTDTEPILAVEVAVENGFFSVMIGDGSIPNMAPLEASIFNTDAKICLRTWFSDGIGEFEQMTPDKQISNPELIGLEQEDEALTIYVNAATGNDNNSGLNEEQPKETIQGAVDAIPTNITGAVNIVVATGVYREGVTLRNLVLTAPEAAVTITGDTVTPSNVRIAGSDEGDDGTAVREFGFLIENVAEITIEGFLIDTTTEWGIHQIRSTATISNCEIQNTARAIKVDHGSSVEISYTDISDCENGIITFGSLVEIRNSTIENMTTGYGIFSMGHCTVRVYDTEITDTYQSGAKVAVSSYLLLQDCVFDNCGQNPNEWFLSVNVEANAYCKLIGTTIQNGAYGGIVARRQSYIWFHHDGTSQVNNCAVGARAEFSSSIVSEYPGTVTMSGNTVNYESANNSYTYNLPANP